MSTTLLPTHRSPHERLSIESHESHELSYEAKLQSELSFPARVSNGMSALLQRLPFSSSSARYHYPRRRDYEPLGEQQLRLTPTRRYTRRLRRIPYYLAIFFAIIAALAAITFAFFPSYTHPPPHYTALRNHVLDPENANQTGRGNLHDEKVFIAASLYDPTGELARGHWATSLLALIDLLGEENVYLSIYENDSEPEGAAALAELDDRVPCNRSLVYDAHLDLDALPTITIPDGTRRVKRITYLAETRNRALAPLEDKSTAASTTKFDKLLYLNDIAFDPLDALQLLFSTHVDERSGRTEYRAACAVDFINPFKFYDTYATRDLDGYSMGVPFFPWFTNEGVGARSSSRAEVLAGSDAVPVRSCWGGMVAFDARFFQQQAESESKSERLVEDTDTAAQLTSPARFRALNDTDLFWDASECCLIHADIQEPLSHGKSGEASSTTTTGIYMNPFVRVAYDPNTLSWLGTTRRFEKLYFVIHNIVNHLVGLPWFNARREEVPGRSYHDTVFVPGKNGGAGSFESVQRVGRHDGFCGRPGLQVVAPHQGRGKGWETIPMPLADLT
ncbi:cryptococcal mannosyltransferase 1-domain-containing protein [Aspergillus pseudoustus]|uniref:Cryptococcal mannosyltransferase 1-domain-containing protein n=1 Tax=Aspergillus pseudoustus TaxID=1810923 RepID=A0ABR4KXT8_9EURO